MQTALKTVLLTTIAALVLGSSQTLADQAAGRQKTLSEWAKLLSSGDVKTRIRAAQGIAQFGAQAEPVVPALIGVLKDPEPTVRMLAADTLGEIGPAAQRAVPALMQSLDDDVAEVRTSAAKALGSIGTAAERAVGQLRGLLDDPDEQVRLQARAAIDRIVEGTGSTPEGLSQEGPPRPGADQTAEDDKQPEPEDQAKQKPRPGKRPQPPGTTPQPKPAQNTEPKKPELRPIPPQPIPKKVQPPVKPRTIDDLVKSLGNPDAEVRRNTAIALGKLGKVAERAVPALQKARADKDLRVDDAVFWALAWIRYGCDEGLKKLSIVGNLEKCPYVHGRIYWMGGHDDESWEGLQVLTDAGPRLAEAKHREFRKQEHWAKWAGAEPKYFDLALFDQFRGRLLKEGRQEAKLRVEQLIPHFLEDQQKEEKEFVVRVCIDGKTSYSYCSWKQKFWYGDDPALPRSLQPRQVQVAVVTSDCLRLDDTIEVIFGPPSDAPPRTNQGKDLAELIERSRRAMSAGPDDTEFSRMERDAAAGSLSYYLLEYSRQLMRNGRYNSAQILSNLAKGIRARELYVARRGDGKWVEDMDLMVCDMSYLSAVAGAARRLGNREAYVFVGKLAQFAESVPHDNDDAHASMLRSIHSALAELAISCSGDLEAGFEHEMKGSRNLAGFQGLPRDQLVQPLNPDTRWWLGWYGGERPPRLEDLLDAAAGPDDGQLVQQGPQEDTEAQKSAEEAYLRGLKWIKSVGERLNGVRRKVVVLRAELAIQRIALRKTEMKIAYLERILTQPGRARYFDDFLAQQWNELFGTPMPPEPGKVMRTKIQKKLAELRGRREEILAQQDKEIQALRDAYDEIFTELVGKGETAESADIQEFAGKLKERVRFERGVAGMELYLAAGQREKFHDLARVFYEDKTLAPATRLMQGLDYLEHKKMRTALHAFQDCQKLDPDNKVVRELIRQIEVGYLKAIDVKLMAYDKKKGITGDAAALRNACFKRLAGHGEPGFWNAIKDYLTVGSSSIYASLSGGKVSDVLSNPLKGYRSGLEEMMDAGGNMLDEAAVQHAGLLIITRLREKGFTLNEIRQLNNDQFIETIKEHFKPKRDTLIARLKQKGLNAEELQKVDDAALLKLGKKHFGQVEPELSKEDAMRMRRTIHAAFQNVDVNRLERGKTEQLNVDTDVSYFDTKAFEQSWSEWCTDAVNLKNVIIFLGPMATVKAGGKLATTGNWGWIGEKAPESLLTVKDLVAASSTVQWVAGKMKNSAVGSKCVEQLMKFDKTTGLMSHMIADAMVQQGMGMAGRYAGGYVGRKTGAGEEAGQVIGEFLAEVFTAYGGGDYDVTVKALKNCGVGAYEVGNVTRQVGKSLAEATDALSRSRKILAPINDVLDDLSQTGKLSKSMRQALKQGEAQIEGRIAQLTQSFEGSQPSRFARHEVARLRLIRHAVKAADNGNFAQAKFLREASRKMGDQLDDYAGYLSKHKKACEALEAKLRGVSSADALNSSPGKVKGPQSVQEALHDSGLEVLPPGRKYPVSHLAKSGKLRKPLRYMGCEADDLMRSRKYDEAAQHYEEMLTALETGGSKNSEAYEELAEKLFLARRAAKAGKGLGDEIDDIVFDNVAAMRKIGDEVDDLASQADVRLVKMKKESLNQTFWVEKKFDQGGKTVWKRVGVFKEANQNLSDGFPEGYDLRGERIYAEFAKEARMLAPACEEVNKIAGKKVRGLFVRLVEGTALDELDDVGMKIVAQKQIARHRVLAALLGDHDRKMANYIVDGNGRVFSIDHGMTDVAECSNRTVRKLIRIQPVNQPIDPISGDLTVEDLIVMNMSQKVTHWRRRAADSLRGIEQKLAAGEISAAEAATKAGKARQLLMLEEQLRWEDMVPTIRKIQQEFSGKAGETKLRKILGRVFKGSELDDAVEVLKVRRDNLFEVLRKAYAVRSFIACRPLPAVGTPGFLAATPFTRPASLRLAA